jgi:serine/threonine-protein kinase
MPMSGEQQVSELLLEWERLRREGRTVPAEELCRDCPQHLEEVSQRIAALQKIYKALDTPESNATVEDRPIRAPAPGHWPAVAGYRIEGELGRGGMGVVYKAWHFGLKREVALKMILAGAHAGERDLERFRTDAEALAQLKHPNVVPIYEIGESEGRPYFSLEFVEGGNLAAHCGGKPLPPQRAAELVEVLARAVQAAHERGIIHRDLKPANVLLTPDGTPKLTDFGLAKRLDAGIGQTQTGAVMGTASYMAPELAQGKAKEAGPAADIYALGAILYELLTGRPPFKAETHVDTLLQVVRDELVPPRRLQPKLPRDLETICLKCLTKNPRQRYASAGELADRLRLYLDGKPIPDRPKGWFVKSWQWARRRPLRSTAILLALSMAIATPFFIYYAAPDRPRKEVVRLLANGEPYVFEGDEETPGPFRWVISDPGPPKPMREEKCWSVQTFTLSLLELVPDPQQESYRFSARLRHDSSADNGRIGIYFGHRIHRTGRAVKHTFYTLSFADQGREATMIRTPEGKPLSRALLQCRYFEKKPAFDFSPKGPVGEGKLFTPALPVTGKAPWRGLAVTVTPTTIRAYWENEALQFELVGEVSRKALVQHTKDFLSVTSATSGTDADFRPRSGLGLFFFRSSASFQRIALEPIPGGN